MEYPRPKNFIEIVQHFLELPVATQKRFFWQMKKFLQLDNFFIYRQLKLFITNYHQNRARSCLNDKRTAEGMQNKKNTENETKLYHYDHLE